MWPSSSTPIVAIDGYCDHLPNTGDTDQLEIRQRHPVGDSRTTPHPQSGARQFRQRTDLAIASARRTIHGVVKAPNQDGPEQDERTKDPMSRGASRSMPNPKSITVLSPVIGAAHSNSFDQGEPQEAAQLSHYLGQTLFSHLFEGSKQRKAWFTVFHEYPILFHAFSHASAVHKDVLLNKITYSNTGQALRHKGRSISLLKQFLANLDTANLEILLIVMVTLATHDLSDSRLYMGTPTGFQAHEAHAYWMDVYGRLDTIPEHLGAIARLVELAGGLDKVKLPGLANCLALTDLMILPSFPNILSYFLVRGKAPGRGFFTNIPGGLPTHTFSAFNGLATVDRCMTKYCGTHMKDDQYRRMMNTRNAMHYSVLALPSWSGLSQSERNGARQALYYEIARIAAVLYSCAVIYGLPPHRNWHIQLASQLESVIEKTTSLASDAPLLLLWALCVGALATFRSPNRKFFETRLAKLLLQQQDTLETAANTEAILEDFLWSPRACGESFAILWKEVHSKDPIDANF